MSNLFRKCRSFVVSEDGQGMVEYGLIIALISIAAITVIVFMGPRILEIFTDANNALNGQAPGGGD